MSRRLQAENGFNALDDSGAADWLWRQCATYDELSEQRQLISITPQVARAARPLRTTPRPGATPATDVEDK
ncbi:hypothetical protein [Streptomyces sp. 135]|uniref:hypothetical protein n=1 Tax=Streptomyces sp. 135 TaxID=2838850 RepID=UPI001CBF341C|nr:hypothetical protein [Streptomyces sp. 135]